VTGYQWRILNPLGAVITLDAKVAEPGEEVGEVVEVVAEEQVTPPSLSLLK
jgi:hypothetical protein